MQVGTLIQREEALEKLSNMMMACSLREDEAGIYWLCKAYTMIKCCKVVKPKKRPGGATAAEKKYNFQANCQ